MTGPVPSRDPVPAGPVHEPPRGYLPRDVRSAVLRRALLEAGVVLGAYDVRMLDWLAGWDWPTVAVITSWVGRSADGRAVDVSA